MSTETHRSLLFPGSTSEMESNTMKAIAKKNRTQGLTFLPEDLKCPQNDTDAGEFEDVAAGSPIANDAGTRLVVLSALAK